MKRQDRISTLLQNFYARYQNCASWQHWIGLKRAASCGLFYGTGSDPKLIEYADADWGGDAEERKSTSGYLYQLFIWRTKKQSSVALSTRESEYVAFAEAVSEAKWLHGIINELGVKIDSIVIYEDNQSCTKVDETLETKRLKHVDIK